MTSELDVIARSEDWSEVYESAQTYRQRKQWENAAIALQRAVKLKGDFFWSWHYLGDVLGKLKQWQDAANAYSEAVKLDPQFFWSWHNLGDVFSKLEQWQDAANAYSEAIKLDPEFFWSWHNLGDVFSKLEQWEKAIASYLQGIYLEPEYQSYQKLGYAFKQRGLEQTIKHYRQLIREPDPGSIFQLYQTQPQRLIELVNNLSGQHQTHGAIAVCYMVLEIKPTNTDIVLQLSLLLQKQQQLERAIASNQQQLENADSSLLTRSTVNNVPNKVRSIPGKIVLQTNKAISLSQLNDLCVAVGWSNRSLNRLERAINNSFKYVAAWHVDRDKQQLIGFARAVSDGIYQATLLDIAVHPDFQGWGIGKAIAKTIIKQLRVAGVMDITLYASPHMADFYHKLGFVSQPNNLQWMLFSDPSKL